MFVSELIVTPTNLRSNKAPKGSNWNAAAALNRFP